MRYMQPGETVADLARRFGGQASDFVPVATDQPTPTCKRCQGKGYVPAGLRSKRVKPCRCVL